jgi:hypothetical protein
MAITRGFAAAAALAGLAVSATGVASADPQNNAHPGQLSGHYTWTTTSPGGQPTTGDYYFTPCGDGCASAATTPGGPAVAQAHLVDGQWTMDGSWSISCSGGSPGTDSATYHDTWDPNTLAGTDAITYSGPACGNQSGRQQVNNLQLTQAP